MIIEVENVSKRINGRDILREVSYSFKSGYTYGIRGHNGSGKTMLLRLLCGLIYPSEGRVIMDGKELGKDLEFPESVGFLIERPAFLSEFTAFENLVMITSLRGHISKKEIDNVIKNVGLEKHPGKKYRDYSLGMKQRLGIAAAIIGDPQLILLDEPTNALDETGIEEVVSLIKDLATRDRILVIASHDEEFLKQTTDTMFRMKDGFLLI